MGKTKIEWTDETWNPITGCTKVSTGCKNCYAERFYRRFRKAFIGNTFEKLVVHLDRLKQPLHWRKPRRVFVCSMSDLFHPDVAPSTVARILDVICSAHCQRHVFQILTKRPERWREIINWIGEHWPGDSPLSVSLEVLGRLPDNIWMGVSAENQETYEQRSRWLRDLPTANKFVSLEPLLAPVTLFADITDNTESWVIVGGESGPKARPMETAWAYSILQQCHHIGIPFFMKQLSQGSAPKTYRDFHAFPAEIRYRELPRAQEMEGHENWNTATR